MKLERFDVYADCKNYDCWYVAEEKHEEGDCVRWTPDLQEAWDKQQEMELVNDDYCPVCEINVNCYELSKYCSNCGQKIKR